MKYAVVSNSNGTFKIESEWTDNLEGAKNNYWDKCKAFNSAKDVVKATVELVDENWDIVEGKRELIEHPVEPTPVTTNNEGE